MLFFPRFLLYCIFALLLLSSCQTGPDVPYYRGYTFDATIDGVRVLPLKKSQNIPALQGYMRDVRWQMNEPISGYLNVVIAPNSHSGLVGNNVYIEDIQIVPLSRVKIKTYRALSRDNSVLIGGRATVTDVNVMDQQKLPAGEYVIRLKIQGSKNWDRKEIYARVR